MKNIKKILEIDYVISAVCLVALVLLTITGVVMRYIFNNPIAWLEEVQSALILWTVFFGGSLTFRKRSHISIELVVDMLPSAVQKVVHILIYVIVILILGFISVQGISYISNMASIGRVTSVLQIPSQYVYFAFPAGAILMLINFALEEIKYIIGKNNKQEVND